MSVQPVFPDGTNLPRPPRWAEALMGTLVPIERKESITGDLLEEYRQAVVPRRGRVRADLWYGRQIARALWALIAMLFVAALTVSIAREVLDELVPASPAGNYQLRAAVLTWAMIACCFSAGAWTGWRTGRAAAGAIAAPLTFGAAVLGGFVASFACRMFGVQSAYSAIEVDRPLAVIIVPLVALVFTAGLGMSGATAGVLLRRKFARTANV